MLLLTEMLLQPGTVFNVPRYQTYRTDRPPRGKGNPGGGTAILIQRRIADRCFLAQGQHQVNVRVTVDLSSDHVPSVVEIMSSPTSRTQPHTVSQDGLGDWECYSCLPNERLQFPNTCSDS
ncbi:hypothetical protein J6590_070641 [Homalodisca vitripennis]|nr:hypothetical protein J6590_070641 [Homalodisca vitripennis]